MFLTEKKGLVVKKILEFKRFRFLCRDFVEYLRTNQNKFDVIIASGVYHLLNPAELITLVAKASARIFIWTHYYDLKIISKNPNLAYKVSEGVPASAKFQHTYLQEYRAALDWQGFCDGSSAPSHWLSRDDVIACLKYFRMNNIQINFEAPDSS